MYSYEWIGGGLVLKGPEGEVFLQGEEANNLIDELDSLETDEQIQVIISEYSEVMYEV